LKGIAGVPRRGARLARHQEQSTDVYEDYESDERWLNDQTGHRNSESAQRLSGAGARGDPGKVRGDTAPGARGSV
jgi:hypothetical protein